MKNALCTMHIIMACLLIARQRPRPTPPDTVAPFGCTLATMALTITTFTIHKSGLHGRSCHPIWDVSASGLSCTRLANFLPPGQYIGWDVVLRFCPGFKSAMIAQQKMFKDRENVERITVHHHPRVFGALLQIKCSRFQQRDFSRFWVRPFGKCALSLGL